MIRRNVKKIISTAIILTTVAAGAAESAEGVDSSVRSIRPLEVPPTPSHTAGVNRRDAATDTTGRWIYLSRPKLGLGLTYHFEEERREGPNSSSTDTTREFRERLIVETNGWVYNPALMKLRLRLEPEWQQLDQDRTAGGDGSSNEFLAGYDAEARFLDPKPISLRIYGQRDETTLRSAFAQSSDSAIDTYGADLFFKYRALPTTARYVHRDVDQTGFFNSREIQDQYSIVSRRRTGRSQTRITATYSENERTTQGTATQIDTLNTDLSNDWHLTSDGNVRLSSFWNYRDSQSGSLDTRDLRLREGLDWRHRPNLRSNYNLIYNQAETGDFEFESMELNGRMTHLHKDELTSAGGLGYTRNDFTGGEEQIYRSNMDFTYRRPINWGRMNLFAGANYDVTTRDLRESSIQVIGENQTLSTTSVTFLDNPNVTPGSVTVRNQAQTIIFTEGVDYLLTPVGNQVRISRTAFGAIAEGETVRVDYTFTSDPSFDDAVLRQRYGAEFFLWSSLTLSYRYQQSDQNVLDGPEPSNPADERVHSLLTRYTRPWFETRLAYEDAERDSGVSTTQWTAEQVLRRQAGRKLLGTITGAYVNTRFKEQDETEEIYSMRVRGDYLPRPWAKASVEGFWEDIDGDVRQVVNTGVNARIDLSYRIWQGGLKYSFLDEHDKISDNRRRRQTFQIDLIRMTW